MPDSTTHPALGCHEDLLHIITLIKDHPVSTKKQLMTQHFTTLGGSTARVPAVSDQDRAFNLAVSILLYINCGVPGGCADILEDSAESFPWNLGLSVTSLIAEAFQKDTGMIHGPRRVETIEACVASGLTARLLKERAGLRFEATDDLRSHLKLDPRTRTVYVFDCTAVLEEMLSGSQNVLQHSTLPRGLIFETLHTIYGILFPPGLGTEVFASSLTRRGFGKHFLRYRMHRLRQEDDDPEIDYAYFGERLVELHNELKDPSPRNWFERLFEGGTKSAERKMLMATTIGVFIAVTIGLFGLVIAGFQAWVGYQQWKHPVKDQ